METRSMFMHLHDSKTVQPRSSGTTFEPDWLYPLGGMGRVYCTVIDRKILGGRKERLADFNESEELMLTIGCPQHPKEMASMIYMLQEACTHVDLGGNNKNKEDKPKQKKNKKTKKKSSAFLKALLDEAEEQLEQEDDNDDDDEKEGGGSDEQKKEDDRKTGWSEGATYQDGDKIYETIEQYVENLYDGEGVLIGWRIWHVVFGTEVFNLNVAIVRLIMLYQKEEEKKQKMAKRPSANNKKKTDDLRSLAVSSVKRWVSLIIYSYLLPLFEDGQDTIPAFEDHYSPFGDPFPAFSPNDPRNVHYPLFDIMNPCNLNYVLSFEKSCRLIKKILPTARAEYTDPAAYRTGFNFTFPHLARYISPQDRRSAVFHQSLLVEDETSRMGLKRFGTRQMTVILSKVQEAEVKRMKLRSSDMVDIVTQMKQVNLASKAVWDKETFDLWQQKRGENTMEVEGAELEFRAQRERLYFETRIMNNSHTREAIRSLFAVPDDLDPGHAGCIRHIEQEKLKAAKKGEGGRKWSAMRVDHVPLDSNMSPFAWFVSREIFLLEAVFGVLAFHHEISFTLIWRLGLFDSRTHKFFSHLLFSGPNSAGKSFLQELLDQVSAKGTFLSSCHESDKAFTTNVNLNGVIKGQDELGKHVMDESVGGEGNPLIKTALTKQSVETTTIEFDPDTGERETVVYKSQLAHSWIAGTNISAGDIALPMLSRFVFFEVSRHLRNGVDVTMKNEELESDPRDVTMKADKVDELIRTQCLVACLELLIKAGFLPVVDMRAVISRWGQIKAVLAGQGVTVDPRKDHQVRNHIRCCALMEAVMRVFSTREVFQDENREFQYEDLLECAPFLFATEEHLIFSLYQMEHIIVRTDMDTVLSAIGSACVDANTKETQFSYTIQAGVAGKDKGGGGNGEDRVYDYNYVLLKTPYACTTPAEIMKAGGKSIVDHVRKTMGKHLLALNVEYVFKTLKDETMEVVPYDEHGYQKGDKKIILPTLRIRQNVSNVSGIEVLRHSIAFASSRAEGEGDGGGSGKTINTEKSVLANAINATFTCKTQPRRLIIGKTFRDHHDMVPYLFKVVDIESNKARKTKVVNLKYRMEGYGECVSGVAREKSGPKWTEIEKDVDTFFYEAFQRRTGIYKEKKDFPVCKTWQKEGEKKRRVYPEYFLDIARREKKMEEESSVTAATVAATPTTTVATTTTTTPVTDDPSL